jgi:hypothetical protein
MMTRRFLIAMLLAALMVLANDAGAAACSNYTYPHAFVGECVWNGSAWVLTGMIYAWGEAGQIVWQSITMWF